MWDSVGVAWRHCGVVAATKSCGGQTVDWYEERVDLILKSTEEFCKVTAVHNQKWRKQKGRRSPETVLKQIVPRAGKKPKASLKLKGSAKSKPSAVAKNLRKGQATPRDAF